MSFMSVHTHTCTGGFTLNTVFLPQVLDVFSLSKDLFCLSKIKPFYI